MEKNYLVQDLTTVVVTAGVISIVFSILRWPSILGYLLSGLIIGPYLTSNFAIRDQASIQNISELGVIFLMFCIGLEFDLKKLKQTLFPSLLAMFFQAIFAFFTGIITARLLGWTSVLGIFLGAIFAISSSMVAIPIIKQQNAMQQPFAQFTMGVAILEDIFAVVLLVILSNLRQSGFNFSECFNLVFWITVFISSMLIFGRLVAQRFIRLLGKIHNDEIVHICVTGLILLLSELSSGYSNALGAFLAGAIFSNTQIIGRLENIVAPIRDIFTAVFFVSIGMLIDPKILWDHKWLILILTSFVVGGQFISAWLGFFLSGQKPSVAFRASLPKSQIGEFSFVIAALAQTLGLDDGQLMAITVGVSLFSIIIVNILCTHENELLIKCTEKMPLVLRTWSNLYQNILLSIQNRLSGSLLITLIRRPLLKVVIHFLLVNAIIWCNSGLCHFFEQHPLPYTEIYSIWLQRILSLIAFGIALPFMGGVVRNLNLIIIVICKHALRDLFVRLNHHAAFYKIFQLLITTIATLIFTWIFLVASASYLPAYMPLLLLVAIGTTLGFVFWRRLRILNSQFEFMFLESFSNRLESENEKRRQAMIKMITQKHPWDIKTRQITVPPQSHLIGLRLFESQLREKTHTLLLGIGRDGFFSDLIHPNSIFYPNDTLFLLGSEKQLSNAEKFIAVPQKQMQPSDSELDFDQVVITDNHPLLNETVASANVRQRFGINIVGIQRKDHRIESLAPNDIFKIGDCVLLVGLRSNLEKIKALTCSTIQVM